MLEDSPPGVFWCALVRPITLHYRCYYPLSFSPPYCVQLTKCAPPQRVLLGTPPNPHSIGFKRWELWGGSVLVNVISAPMEQSPKSILPLYYKLTLQQNDMYKLKSKLSPDTGCTGAVFLHIPADRAVRNKYCLLQEPSFITVKSREKLMREFLLLSSISLFYTVQDPKPQLVGPFHIS